MDEISTDLLLHAYRSGVFPMAEPSEDNALYWYAPDPRAILPLDGLRVSKSLRRMIRQRRYAVTCDRDFPAVIQACSRRAEGRPQQVWISPEIEALYTELHSLGRAHSVECWEDGALVGGLYGVSIAGAFFGESMFHTARDASKVALALLVARLRKRGYSLLDTQFVTPHLVSLGAVEIPRSRYQQRLAKALALPVDWGDEPMEDFLCAY